MTVISFSSSNYLPTTYLSMTKTSWLVITLFPLRSVLVELLAYKSNKYSNLFSVSSVWAISRILINYSKFMRSSLLAWAKTFLNMGFVSYIVTASYVRPFGSLLKVRAIEMSWMVTYPLPSKSSISKFFLIYANSLYEKVVLYYMFVFLILNFIIFFEKSILLGA